MTRRIWLLGIGLAVLASAAGFSIMRRPKPAPGPELKTEFFQGIHVEVLNGCGADGVAQRVGRHLRGLGFDVMSWENAESFNYPETIVIDRVGKPEYARKVADALGVRNRIQQIIPDPFRIEQVTVIVGRDYPRLNLPPAL